MTTEHPARLSFAAKSPWIEADRIDVRVDVRLQAGGKLRDTDGQCVARALRGYGGPAVAAIQLAANTAAI